MRTRMFCLWAILMVLVACGGESFSPGPLGEGGEGAQDGGKDAAGGTSTGGQPSTGGKGGSGATGGASTGGSSTGGASTGGSSTGGASTGGSSTGGASTGGASTGGTSTGGASTGGTSTGGGPGTGGNPSCGALETAHAGLCVAAMVPFEHTSAPVVPKFEIDVTEVTVGQYQSWLATSPALSGPVECASNSSYVPNCTYGSSPKLPVICVDWCDANAYCEAVGKRLCESIPSVGFSEWQAVCRNVNQNSYPYPGAFQASTCNGQEAPGDSLVEVASMSGCVTPTGVYDMVGNVEEWTRECTSGLCAKRGGSYQSPFNLATCSLSSVKELVSFSSPTLGFRCCRD